MASCGDNPKIFWVSASPRGETWEIYFLKLTAIKVSWVHKQFSNLQIFIQLLEQALELKKKSHGLYYINLSFSVNIRSAAVAEWTRLNK